MYWFLCFMGGAADPEYSSVADDKLRDRLVELTNAFDAEEGVDLVTPTADHVISSYQIPNQAGTLLHNYLERKIQGLDTDTIKLFEPEDWVQADSLVEWAESNDVVFHALEARLGSFTHQVCGSADAIVRNPDGTYTIWDWKRVGEWLGCGWMNTDEHTLVINNLDHTLSSKLVEYMFQLAVYRKLFMLQDPNHVVTTSAYLVVFHPALKSWRRLEIQLDDKLRPDTGKFLPVYGRGPFSPIEYVDMMFESRREHLEEYLTKD